MEGRSGPRPEAKDQSYTPSRSTRGRQKPDIPSGHTDVVADLVMPWFLSLNTFSATDNIQVLLKYEATKSLLIYKATPSRGVSSQWGLTTTRRQELAGLVISWMLSRNTFRCLLMPPFPSLLPPFPRPANRRRRLRV